MELEALPQEQVQHTLSTIGYGKPFCVSFLKKDNTKRTIKAMMEKPKKELSPNGPVPVLNLGEGGYSSFYTDRVIEIKKELEGGN